MDITLRDYSNLQEKTYMPIMENGWKDSGFDLTTVEVKETELGVYATYIYKVEQLKEEQYIGFVLSDTDGNKFDYMPYYINGGEEILENGYHKVTYAYQKLENVSDLHFFYRVTEGRNQYNEDMAKNVFAYAVQTAYAL